MTNKEIQSIKSLLADLTESDIDQLAAIESSLSIIHNPDEWLNSFNHRMTQLVCRLRREEDANEADARHLPVVTITGTSRPTHVMAVGERMDTGDWYSMSGWAKRSIHLENALDDNPTPLTISYTITDWDGSVYPCQLTCI